MRGLSGRSGGLYCRPEGGAARESGASVAVSSQATHLRAGLQQAVFGERYCAVARAGSNLGRSPPAKLAGVLGHQHDLLEPLRERPCVALSQGMYGRLMPNHLDLAGHGPGLHDLAGISSLDLDAVSMPGVLAPDMCAISAAARLPPGTFASPPPVVPHASLSFVPCLHLRIE